MVPEPVEKYIVSRGLYADGTAPLLPLEIPYREYGPRSAPALVLIQESDSSPSTFDSVVRQLAEHFRVIVYDQREPDKNVGRGEGYSTNTLAQDLRVLLDHMQLQSVFLLGHGMGARTATRFTSLYPGRVKALIIEDMEPLPREDFSSDFSRHKMPILVMQADPKKSAISLEGLNRLRKHLPRAQFFTIPGANHYIHQNSPTQFLNTVLPFLRRALIPPALTCRGVVGG
jgi:pimeloyl-ACP methyl ester carboxylesterase